MCGHETDGAGVPPYGSDEPTPEALRDAEDALRALDSEHPTHCACEACDPLYQMTREGD